MAIIPNSLIEVVLVQSQYNQQVLNVFQYLVADDPALPSAVQIAEAWWNDIKTTYRALIAVGFGDAAFSVKLRELNNLAGDYGEYDIPLAERVGTRANPAQAEGLPSFNAAATRWVVGTRATRPGQKRTAFLMEGDNSSGGLQASYKTPLSAFMTHMTSFLTLGAPAALTRLQPIICRKDASGFVVAHQDVTGFIIANQISSQNTRKIGRGA